MVVSTKSMPKVYTDLEENIVGNMRFAIGRVARLYSLSIQYNHRGGNIIIRYYALESCLNAGRGFNLGPCLGPPGHRYLSKPMIECWQLPHCRGEAS